MTGSTLGGVFRTLLAAVLLVVLLPALVIANASEWAARTVVDDQAFTTTAGRVMDTPALAGRRRRPDLRPGRRRPAHGPDHRARRRHRDPGAGADATRARDRGRDPVTGRGRPGRSGRPTNARRDDRRHPCPPDRRGDRRQRRGPASRATRSSSIPARSSTGWRRPSMPGSAPGTITIPVDRPDDRAGRVRGARDHQHGADVAGPRPVPHPDRGGHRRAGDRRPRPSPGPGARPRRDSRSRSPASSPSRSHGSAARPSATATSDATVRQVVDRGLRRVPEPAGRPVRALDRRRACSSRSSRGRSSDGVSRRGAPRPSRCPDRRRCTSSRGRSGRRSAAVRG